MAMSKGYALRGLVILALAACGGWAWRALAPRALQPRVAVTRVAHGDFVVSLLTEGTLQSDDAITVRAGKAPGQLTRIASDGTVVRAGDVFCQIEARDLLRKQTDDELAYKQAKEEIAKTRDSAQERHDNDQRSVEQADKNLKVWEESTGTRTKQAEDQLAFDGAEAERLRLEYDREQRMADKGYSPGSEAEIAKAAYEAQQFKVEQSQKDLELNRRQIAAERSQRQSGRDAAQRRAEISRSRIQDQVSHAQRRAEVAKRELDNVVTSLADTTIKASASGTVSLFSTFRGGERRSWREGDQVSSGTPLGSISSSENMSVRCRVKEALISELRKGQQAEIEFDAAAGRTFSGELSSVGAVARQVWIWEDPTAEANARVFDVLVKVKQTPAQHLKPGLNARVRITLRRLPDTLSAPLDSVFERDGRSYVYVKQGDRFARREVATGERNEVAVVLRKGVSADETIALSDPTRAPEAKARKAR